MKTKIKIISCVNDEYWYKNRIGQVLIVNKVKGYYGEDVYEYHENNNGNIINGLFHIDDIIEVNNNDNTAKEE